MKLQTYAYLAVGLLLLAAPAGALIPDNITISASPVWLTAGGDNAATITVQVKNSTSPLEGVGVDFDVDGTYGSISPLHAVTDSDGKAMADFRPGTVAGTAKITATVPYEGPDEPLRKSIDLQIDHTIPHAIAGLWYKPEVTAGGEVDITVRMEDRYGNVVDSRREDALGISLQAENVTFMVGSPGGGAAFAGDRDKISVPVDENGNATARLRVDTVAGENVVYIQPPKPIKGEYISITGTADGMPAGIICTPNPPGASVPANGK
ncbi:MAG TPA: invasin domain 3-containing protein, partial [Methanoculleus sp.]|nr:invasin domain 3-containing protein [Methanoculleus sp.]